MTVGFSLVQRPVALAALLAGMISLGGCATRGSVQGMQMQQRVQQQAEADRQDANGKAISDLDSRETYLRVVSQMQEKGLYFASLAHLDALQQRWGRDPQSNLLRADALRQTEQTEAARSLYTELLPTTVRAQAAHGLGLIAGRAGDLPAATEFFLQATKSAPTDVGMLNDLAYALMQRGRWAEARVPLFKASELQNDNATVWSNIALYLTLEGQVANAQSVMDKHQIPAASRKQIVEQARTIQERQRPAAAVVPVAGGPLAPAVAPPVAAAQTSASTAVVSMTTASPVLRPSLGVALLADLPASNTAKASPATSRGLAQ